MLKKDKKKHDETAETCCGQEQCCSVPAEAEAAEPVDPVAELEEKLAAAEEDVLRARADFQNYQRRAIANEREAAERGRAGVLEAMVGVVDHFDVALTQDPEKASAASILDGVGMIKSEMLRAMSELGVTVIDPEIGGELNPGRHEAIGHQPGEGVAAGCVSIVAQVGYAIGERVLRPAKVFVAPEEG